MKKSIERKLSKNEMQSIESGLSIENSIKISYTKNNNSTNIILLLIISLMGLFGTIFSFISIFNIGVNTNSILLYTFIFFIIFFIIFLLPDKFMFSIFPILLIFLYFFKDYLSEFVLGFKIVANHIANTVYSAGVWSKYYQVPTDIVQSKYATLFFIFCIFILTILICLFTIKIQSCVMGFALTFPFIECGLYFGAVPNYIAFFMVVCYWIALLSMALSGCKKSTKNKSAGFVRVGNSFYAKSDCNFKVSEKIGISSVIMCLICALLSAGLVSLSGYERSQKIDNIRNDVKTAVENFSLDDASYTLSRLSNMFTSGNNGSFNGTLGQKDKVEYEDKEKLVIQTSNKPSDDIYLKGYVGSIYSGQSWDKLDKDTYKSDIFNDFESNNFYPQDLPFYILNSLDFSTYYITITPANKNQKTTFVPYYSTIINDFSYTYDNSVQSKDTREYSFEAINVSIDDFINLDNSISNINYFNHNSYKQFVTENYLTVEDNQDMQDILNLFSEYIINEYNLDFDTFNIKADYKTKLEYIRNFLCSNYEYTLEPGRTPINQDYVLYFLSTSKKGYCSHFASAGTLLCRIMGIPARYVEGYYVSNDNFTQDTYDGTTYTVSVKDNLAHAWTEIYIDNLGWTSYEFTPGFNGNPTMADFTEQTAPEETSNNGEQTETSETNQPAETQSIPVTEQPADVTTAPQDTSYKITETTTSEVVSLNDDTSTINPQTLRTIKHIIVIILSIALIVAFTILRRNYILNDRSKKISSADNKKSILASYGYIISLFKYVGFKRNDNTHYMKFAIEISSNLDYAKDFPSIMELILKTDLSNSNITNDEKLMVSRFAYNTAKTIYNKQSKVGKFIMKYIICLI